MAVEVERDSFDAALDDSNNKSLSDKLGLSPSKGAKAKKGGKKADGFKQTKLNFGAKKTPEKGEDDNDLDEFDKGLAETIPLR